MSQNSFFFTNIAQPPPPEDQMVDPLDLLTY